MRKNYIVFLALCIACIVGVCLYYAIIPMISTGKSPLNNQATSYPSYDAPFGKLILATNIPDASRNMTLYRVTPQDNDMIDYFNGDPVNEGGNVTSEAEAPEVAKKILNEHGGLPAGARLIRVETEYGETINGITGQVVKRTPELTTVQYGRSLDNVTVVGGYIRMELGNNGLLLNLRKVWRTVTPAGTIQVIPATEAFNKLLNGEILNEGHPKCDCDLTVTTVKLDYLEKGYNVSQEYLQPVWIFSGTLSSGDEFSYRVEAADPATPQSQYSSPASVANRGMTSIITPRMDVSSSVNVSGKTGNTYE
jgi:hypothetical protein